MSARASILPVFVPHLGCPHACVFCNQLEITAPAGNTAPADPLGELNRLLSLPSDGGDRELAFYGGSFTAIPVEQQIRFLEPAAKALAEGVITAIRLSTRPDAVDRETLARLRSYGVGTVELGAQSMRDDVLVRSGRGHTAQDVRNAAALVKEAGFGLVLQMMTGLPSDDDDGAVYTARELIALHPDAVRIYPTVIVKGTRLAAMWQAGKYREHTVEDAVRVCSGLLPLFEEARIPVIRLGLNPTEELGAGGDSARGAALGGAYHPALGELVRARIMRNRLETELAARDCAGRSVNVSVPQSLLSQTVGQHHCNIVWLKDRFHLKELQVRSGDSSQLCISIL
jgi:histone acetyltransferase (RNA polymerase elongator complex component)